MAGEPRWKKFERRIARALGGERCPANSGHKVDGRTPRFVIQCKEVKELSLPALTQLALQAERDGLAEGKIGVVAVKLRRGPGRATPALIVLTEAEFHRLQARSLFEP